MTTSAPTTGLSCAALHLAGSTDHRSPAPDSGLVPKTRFLTEEAQVSIEDLQRGDPLAWKTAWAHVWPRLCNYLKARNAGNHHDRQDLAQMAMTKAARRVLAGQVNNLDHFLLLSIRIAKSLSVDLARSSGRRQALEEKLLDSDPGNPDQREQLERCELLARALHQLSEQEYGFVYSRFVEGLKVSEISQKYNRPLGSVCSSLQRALPKLRRSIRQESWFRTAPRPDPPRSTPR